MALSTTAKWVIGVVVFVVVVAVAVGLGVGLTVGSGGGGSENPQSNGSQGSHTSSETSSVTSGPPFPANESNAMIISDAHVSALFAGTVTNQPLNGSTTIGICNDNAKRFTLHFLADGSDPTKKIYAITTNLSSITGQALTGSLANMNWAAPSFSSVNQQWEFVFLGDSGVDAGSKLYAINSVNAGKSLSLAGTSQPATLQNFNWGADANQRFTVKNCP